MLLKLPSSAKATERSFRDAMHAAMGLLGWLCPDTEKAVATITDQDDEDLQEALPEELRNPFASLDRDRPQVHLDQ